jgi:hypothetical protein
LVTVISGKETAEAPRAVAAKAAAPVPLRNVVGRRNVLCPN